MNTRNFLPFASESAISKSTSAPSERPIQFFWRRFVESGQSIVSKPDNYKATSIKTAVYPGFPTDLQQPFTVLQTQ